MRFAFTACIAAAWMSSVFAHMEQLESGKIDYFWLKGSDGSSGQWLAFNSTKWHSLTDNTNKGDVVHITSVEQFNSFNPLPENGLFSVPKGSSIGDLAVYYDHEAKDDYLKKPIHAEFEFTCIIKLCKNSN
ncbi:hypothetical protein EC968_008107 [Mortierella alpina]|nr:hypothetical protein EC968_008107 [Mortierella alpina]